MIFDNRYKLLAPSKFFALGNCVVRMLDGLALLKTQQNLDRKNAERSGQRNCGVMLVTLNSHDLHSIIYII